MTTIPTITPDPPTWVEEAGKEAVWAWEHSLSWRCDAAQAKHADYCSVLILQAKDAYHGTSLYCPASALHDEHAIPAPPPCAFAPDCIYADICPSSGVPAEGERLRRLARRVGGARRCRSLWQAKIDSAPPDTTSRQLGVWRGRVRDYRRQEMSLRRRIDNLPTDDIQSSLRQREDEEEK